MAWEVAATDEFTGWYARLDEDATAAVMGRVDLLAEEGPSLGRPLVDTVKGSSFANMKELRCGTKGAIRVLFIFDPSRQAVLLLGGEKAGRWTEWYDETIPRADALYREYLAETGRQDQT